jgi:hypothetical protein
VKYIGLSYDSTIWLCSWNDTSVSCSTDKLDNVNPRTVTAYASTPASSSTKMINKSTFGWKGHTSTVTTTVIGDPNVQGTFIRQGETKALRTNTDLSVSATNPVAGEVVLTAPVDMTAQLIVTRAGPDLSPKCLNGLGLIYTGNGTPILCRDSNGVLQDLNGNLLGAGDGKRYLKLIADAVLTDAQWTLVDDKSVLSPLEGLGLFQKGVFYSQDNLDGTFSDIKAFTGGCGQPPCIVSATTRSDGASVIVFRKATDGSDLARLRTPLQSLYALMDFVVGPVGAGTIKPPTLTK